MYEYPITQAALARAKPGDPRVAERFELYVCGVELANAFAELTDAAEQRRRFEAAMAEKERLYGERYPIDEDFIAALPHMPPASGIALGFDRLVMLATGAQRIEQVLWSAVPEPAIEIKRKTMKEAPLRNVAQLIERGLAPAEQRAELEKVAQRYAVTVPPALAALIDPRPAMTRSRGNSFPDARELEASAGRGTPIRSAMMRIARSKASCIVIPTAYCSSWSTFAPVYCRFCFRREMVGPGKPAMLSRDALAARSITFALTRNLGGHPDRRRSAGAVAAPDCAR